MSKSSGDIESDSWVLRHSAFLLVIAYILYVIEVFKSGTLRYLWRLSSVEDVLTFIDRLKRTPPVIWWACECFHFETRTRTVTEYYTEYESYYDYSTRQTSSRPVQKTRLRQEQYEEKVVTYSEREEFKYKRFEDDSGAVSAEIHKFNATKIMLQKEWYPANFATSQMFTISKQRFIERNNSRDMGFTFWEGYDILGFHSRKLALVDVKKRNPMIHWAIFLFVSLLGGTWFYRRWLERVTVRGTFTIRTRIHG